MVYEVPAARESFIPSVLCGEKMCYRPTSSSSSSSTQHNEIIVNADVMCMEQLPHVIPIRNTCNNNNMLYSVDSDECNNNDYEEEEDEEEDVDLILARLLATLADRGRYYSTVPCDKDDLFISKYV